MSKSGSLWRSSAVMSAGTIVSRLLGFVRAWVLIQAIGSTLGASDAFDIANKLPNTLYMLLIGGALNAVLVPQIVAASKARDGGADYLNRLVTLCLVTLGGLTILLTLATPWVARVYSAEQVNPDMLGLTVAFAYICIPQTLFYGLYTVFGQILNARGSFGPFMWAPVANNVVAIGGLWWFMAEYGAGGTAATEHAVGAWTAGMIWIVAGTATLGVAVQALCLIPALRSAGFRYRPTFGFRGVGLGSAGRVAGWTVGGAVLGQLVFMLTSRVANTAREASADPGVAGNAAYTTAFLLFMLPHSVIVVSLVTAMFTRMSHAVQEGALRDIARDTSMLLRVTGIVTIVSTAGLVALAYPITLILVNDPVQARAVARVVATMSLGLLPFGANYLLQRVFYAFKDGAGPFWAQLPNLAVIAGINVAALGVAPAAMVPLVGAGMSIGNLAGLLTAWVLVGRHIPTTQPHEVLGVWLRCAIAAALGALPAAWVSTQILGWLGESVGGAAVAVLAAGLVLIGIYGAVLLLLRVSEANALVRVVTRRYAR